MRRKLRRRTWRQRCTVGFGTLGRKSAPLPAWDRTAGEQVRREFGWESYLAQSYQVQTELSGQVLTLSYSPDLGRSVPLPRMTLNSSGLSCALHSSSVFWISKSMLELVGVDARAPMRLVRWWLGAARSPSSVRPRLWVKDQVRLDRSQRGGLCSVLPPKSRTGVKRAWSVSGYQVHRMLRNTERL